MKFKPTFDFDLQHSSTKCRSECFQTSLFQYNLIYAYSTDAAGGLKLFCPNSF